MLMSIQKSTPPTAGIATSGAAPLLSKVFGGHLSQKCSFYYNDFNAEAQQTLDEIGERVKPQLEKLRLPLQLEQPRAPEQGGTLEAAEPLGPRARCRHECRCVAA